MIVDSSALVAMIYGEEGANGIFALLQSQPGASLSAANYVEAGIVIDASGQISAAREFDDLLSALEIVIRPVTDRQARIARDAYRAYGRASGHRARLNFGDCFGYALAIDRGEPLLFVGDDFTHTDVRAALPRPT